jgi:cobalamin biosynthesis Mg chelatase CobN
VRRASLTLSAILTAGLVLAALAPLFQAAPAEPVRPRQIFGTTTTKPATTTTRLTTTTVATTTTTRPATTTTAHPTTTSSSSTTSTSSTVVTIPGGAPPPAVTAPPSTIPLETHASNGHVNAFFPALSIVGIVVVLGMMGAQWFLTRPARRPGRRGSWTF